MCIDRHSPRPDPSRVPGGARRRRCGRGALVLLALLLGEAPLAGQEIDGGAAISRRTLVAGVTVTHERWDRYWEGTLRRGNENVGTVTTESAALTAGYGVTDRLSVTAALPYVRTRASRGTLRGMHGVQDVEVAARYALVSAPLGAGRVALAVGGAVGLPLGGYAPDLLPLSIGLGSRRVSARASVGWTAPAGWSLGAAAAYTWRGAVRLDRDAYYADGALHLGDRVAMPDVAGYALAAGYGRGRLSIPLSLRVQRTLGGGDIRRQGVPFVSDRMDFVRVDGAVGYTVPAARLTLRVGAGRVVHGRNVGQATTFTSGVAYAVPF